MEKTEVAQKVRDVIEETLRLDAPIMDDSIRLVEDLNADSVDQVSIILALEDELGGELDDERAKNIATVEDIIETVWQVLQETHDKQ